MRLALLVRWQEKGYTCPRYGFVDEGELALTGTTTFKASSGELTPVGLGDLLLLSRPAGATAQDALAHA